MRRHGFGAVIPRLITCLVCAMGGGVLPELGLDRSKLFWIPAGTKLDGAVLQRAGCAIAERAACCRRSEGAARRTRAWPHRPSADAMTPAVRPGMRWRATSGFMRRPPVPLHLSREAAAAGRRM